MRIQYKKIELPFQYPFTISKGRSKTCQPSLVVSLEKDGLRGFGEAPAITYYDITVEKMIEALESKRVEIEKFAFKKPETFWDFIVNLFPDNLFLCCALDIAAWDLYGKLQGKLLYELWKTPWKKVPMTDYTIGIDTIDNMVAKMKAHPWPIYKIKVGDSQDVDMVRALRKNTSASFILDANAGWTLEEALTKIPLFKELRVDYIEQPLAKDNWKDMKILHEKSILPLYADEACVKEADVEKCAGYFHGINIKLTKCGGITPALRMVTKAKKLGLKVMMGSMNECSIGSAAIANFLPQLDHVDMDGPLLLKEDVARGIEYAKGIVSISGDSGLGIDIRNSFKVL